MSENPYIGATIENIRRNPANGEIHADLLSPYGQLLISATLYHIVAEINERLPVQLIPPMPMRRVKARRVLESIMTFCDGPLPHPDGAWACYSRHPNIMIRTVVEEIGQKDFEAVYPGLYASITDTSGT